MPRAQGAWPSSFASYQESALGDPWFVGGTPQDAGGPMEVLDSAALGCRAGSVPSPCEGRVPSVVMAALVRDPGPGCGAGSGRGPEPPARTCRVYAVPPLGEETYAPKGEAPARPVRRQPPQQVVKAEPDQAPEPCPGQPRRLRAAMRALALIKGELSGSESGGDESDAGPDGAGDDDSGRCGREARRMRRARLAEGCAGGSGDEAPGGWSARERKPLSSGALRGLHRNPFAGL